MRILVADDQVSVARSLCDGLRREGAHVEFVADGDEALRRVASAAFDFVIVDMMMPPGEWGGLTFIHELRTSGRHLPVMVLSGEGGKRQLIEAMRLGADDWIDKSNAAAELASRCRTIVDRVRSDALDQGVRTLPSTIAQSLARHARTTRKDQGWVIESLGAIELALRLASLVGLATLPSQPLTGVRAEQVARPSMGVWFQLCCSLFDLGGHDDTPFACLAFPLVGDTRSRRRLSDLVSVRNGIAHGGRRASKADADQLQASLVEYAHRASSMWNSSIARPLSLNFDGTWFSATVQHLVGEGEPRPGHVLSRQPLVTDQPILVPAAAEPVPLVPWFVGRSVGESWQLLLFDGVSAPRGKTIPSTAPVRYSCPGSASQGLQDPAMTWALVANWFES